MPLKPEEAALAPDHFKRTAALMEKERAEERRLIRDDARLDLGARERQGTALGQLRLHEHFYGVGEQVLLSFRRETGQPLPRVALDEGDVLRLSPMRAGGSTGTAVSVSDIDETQITLALHGRLPEWITPDGRYQVTQSENERGYDIGLRMLGRVAEAQGGRLSLFRDCLSGRRKPQLYPVTVGEDQWFDAGLNADQRLAVSRALGCQEIALVHGPPGTGKTRVLVEVIRQLIARGQTALVTAPSNAACDHILGRLVAGGVRALRLGHPTRIHPDLRQHTIEARIAAHPLAAEAGALRRDLEALFRKQERERERDRYTRDEMSAIRDAISERKRQWHDLERELESRVLRETQVFVGTLLGVESKLLEGRHFDVVIMDEAAQALEPLSWVALSRGNRAILAGDHCQLPPLVRSPEAAAAGLGITLFERAQALFGEPHVTLLKRQYRMHATIAGFSSEHFYGGLLVADESVASHVPADLPGVRAIPETQAPFLFLDTAGQGFEERAEQARGSRENPEEAERVLAQARLLLDAGVAAGEIAIISPYSAQVRALLSLRPHPDIEVDTVDGFQGREKECVILSLVRSNRDGEMGFLADTRRMNVAMTRARRRLVVIGDGATVSAIPFYAALMAYAERHGCHRTVWETG